MTLRFLLDTNIVSAPFKPRPPDRLLELLDKHAGEAAICTPVWHELRFGCLRLPKSRKRTALDRYLREVVLPNYRILDYDRAASDWHAEERARLTSIGRTPPISDSMIASIACVNGLILVTNNEQDFAGFEGLRVQNWLSKTKS